MHIEILRDLVFSLTCLHMHQRKTMSGVAVIGAGVIGLSAALNIQRSLPGIRVTIIADKFDEETTSTGAGGMIAPFAPGLDKATLKKWGTASMDYFTKLATSAECSESGACLVMGIIYDDKPEPSTGVKQFMLTYDRMPQATADKLGLGQFYCHTGMTVIVYMKKYLPWLMKRFQDQGGVFLKRQVKSFQELAGKYDAVVNCTGLEAQELTGDTKLQPLKGQILYVTAPWVKHFLYDGRYTTKDVNTFVLPNQSVTALGTSNHKGSVDLTVNPEITKTIWNNSVERWPPLNTAKVEGSWVGIRPYREPPRLEKEMMQFRDKTLKVVHNYGHGAYGISLSWGCGVHTAELVKEMLTPSRL